MIRVACASIRILVKMICPNLDEKRNFVLVHENTDDKGEEELETDDVAIDVVEDEFINT